MIHRYLYTMITEAVENISDDVSVLDGLFQDNFVLSDEELNTIKIYWKAHPPNIINGYPRSDSSFPLIAITLSGDRESEYYLNNDAGMITEEGNPYYHMDLQSTMWDYSYDLLIYTEHPDITAYYYTILKFIIIANSDVLRDLDVINIRLEGTELAPDPRYIPEHLFVHRMTFRCESEFIRIDKNSRWGKAFRVEGIHLDRDASKRDIGNVKDNVTIYEEYNE